MCKQRNTIGSTARRIEAKNDYNDLNVMDKLTTGLLLWRKERQSVFDKTAISDGVNLSEATVELIKQLIELDVPHKAMCLLWKKGQ